MGRSSFTMRKVGSIAVAAKSYFTGEQRRHRMPPITAKLPWTYHLYQNRNWGTRIPWHMVLTNSNCHILEQSDSSTTDITRFLICRFPLIKSICLYKILSSNHQDFICLSFKGFRPIPATNSATASPSGMPKLDNMKLCVRIPDSQTEGILPQGCKLISQFTEALIY